MKIHHDVFHSDCKTAEVTWVTASSSNYGLYEMPFVDVYAVALESNPGESYLTLITLFY